MSIYKKTIKYLKKQKKYFKRSEWNKIAEEQNLLSAQTIELIEGKTLRQIILANIE